MRTYGKARGQIEACLHLVGKTSHRVKHTTGLTAYDIADITGYSPQHCNRVLAQMWYEGYVAWKPKDRKHQLMSARLWSWAAVPLTLKDASWNIHPDRLRQMELPL